MSRFESSTFVRNSSSMRLENLIKACDTLGWRYHTEGDTTYITDIGVAQSFGREYAIKITGNQITYNTYYLGNTKEYVEKLKAVYNTLSAEYSKNTVIAAFKKHGFTYKDNPRFVPTESEVFSFYMVGRSNDKSEKEPIGQVKFTILADGTVVSDSNYLPDDVNKRAHASMDDIDSDFESKRVMTKKEVPFEYRERIAKSKAAQSINQK